jgi:hypothetical protein
MAITRYWDSRSVVIRSLVGTLLRWEFGKHPTLLECHKRTILDIIIRKRIRPQTAPCREHQVIDCGLQIATHGAIVQ